MLRAATSAAGFILGYLESHPTMSLKTFFNRPSPSKPGQMSRRMRAALVVGFVAAGAMLLINESAHIQTASTLQ